MVIERYNELEPNFDSSAFTFGEEPPVSIEDFMLFETQLIIRVCPYGTQTRMVQNMCIW